MPGKNVLLAMFDIKPKNKSASLILAGIKERSNLGPTKSTIKDSKSKTTIEMPVSTTADDYWEELFTNLPQRPDFSSKYQLNTSRGKVLKELEVAMSGKVDIHAEIASIGGLVHNLSGLKPRTKIAKQDSTLYDSTVYSKALEDFWISLGSLPLGTPEPLPQKIETAVIESLKVDPAQDTTYQELDPLPQQPAPEVKLAVDNHHHSPASREMEIWLENAQRNQQLFQQSQHKNQNKPPVIYRIKPKWASRFRFNRKALVYFLAVAISGVAAFGFIDKKGVVAKKNIIQNGNNAVANLEDAKKELESFNFLKAADSFALAYDDLNKASSTLSQLGASFLSVFGSVPGLSKVKAANNIIEAGQNISKSGQNLSLAFGTLYKTNLLSFLNTKPNGPSNAVSISKLLGEFKEALNFADRNINEAQHLLSDIDNSVIPENKQQLFLDFKSKIPEFQKYIGDAISYSDFLLQLVGTNGAKTYLVLLQNNSELRPTGGFPGTYALITFENGALKKIFVDDIYRADAGLKDNLVPPIPLQHITPNWGARDANWFADFPLSARKVIELYKLGGGVKIDGILTITPDVIGSIFNVIGPIEMPDYGLTLNANNFLATIQNEVEYQADRSAPKQILSDLQPKFFDKLAKQDKDHWLEIFKIVSTAAEQKHILAYFEDKNLEDLSIKNGLGGEIKSTAGDYLQVVFANVKGSKTDFVTDNSLNLDVQMANNGALIHTLKINRVHNGGDSKYGFYNRDNSAYIKVYVPKGATLRSVKGQTMVDYRPLISYGDFNFQRDQDLSRIEGSIKRPFEGVDVFEESGKTVFGFWLVLKPKQSKSVELQYQIADLLNDKFDLLWQKQSGTGNDQVNFSFRIPESKKVINRSPGLELVGDKLTLSSSLAEDGSVQVMFK